MPQLFKDRVNIEFSFEAEFIMQMQQIAADAGCESLAMLVFKSVDLFHRVQRAQMAGYGELIAHSVKMGKTMPIQTPRVLKENIISTPSEGS